MIKDFTQIQIDDGYHTCKFGTGENDSGTPVFVTMTDIYDIKHFTLRMTDIASTLKLLTFSNGKYPMFHLKFKFYSK